MDNMQQNDPNMVPPGVKKWNWGAFMFNLWWGIGNKVYLSLLCLIPIVNIVMMFILGAKGNEWAWKNNQYRDVEELRRSQESWSRAGLVLFIVSLVGIVLYIIFGAALISMIGMSGFENVMEDTYY